MYSAFSGFYCSLTVQLINVFLKNKLPVVKNLSFESEFKLSNLGPFYSAIVKTANLFVFIFVNFNMTSNLTKVYYQ